ncbi:MULTISPECIES: flagellar assembly protein FliH [Modicisalibacter]|uniref:Flagellar assembly protein FliH n=1 Tax=Modicisalibacter tunisiensis TaxID=390637 RepID=A0ABS7X2T7_9GAMM|nr:MULTISPECIES: flagellar assembly protein FliH [Modicisalibacter]MBZ9568282.1 flagellar assembly protein FliH [Modicisalibacter tunisiensis]
MSDRLTEPEHDTGDWQRWQMDELDSAASGVDRQARDRARREAIRRRALEHQARLDAEREAARREAYEAGYREGLARGEQEGHAQGLKAGREAGDEQMRQEIEQTLRPLRPLAEQFRAALDELDQSLAEQLVDLALATGRQLAGEALEARPEVILDIVRELLHVEPALSGRPRLWLHPADLTLVKAHLGHEFEAAGWQLQPDDTIQRGGCRATSASGDLDATLETRWAAIADQVRRRHGEPGDGSAEASSADSENGA